MPAGRYVLVGANIPGYNDFARSPVHGLVPGVHYHAMALDNLLSYGARYKLNHEWNVEGMAVLAWPGLLTVLAILAVHALWSGGLFLLKQTNWWQMQQRRVIFLRMRAWTDRTTQRGRSGLALLGALAWIARVTLQFISAALLIALLQRISRAGMLPVVELIGMTLLAEAVGYLAQLRWYVLGDAALQPTPVSPPAALDPTLEGRT